MVGRREEKRSLGTRDPEEAKRLHAIFLADARQSPQRKAQTSPQHHPMLAEGNRRLIVIGRDVADGENRHFNPAEHGFMHFPRQVA